MRLRATLLMFLVLGLVAVPAGSAAVPFYWWTNAHAGRAIVAKNPQVFPKRSDQAHTTILKATCKGYRPVKILNRVRYYRAFNCQVSWRDDDPTAQHGPGPFPGSLNCGTTRTRVPGIRCSINA